MLTVTAALKKNFLRRKFFYLWKASSNQKRLWRRAERRREKLAASIKAASEKKRREEVVLAEIQEAQVLKKQLQEAQEKRNEEAERRQEEKKAKLEAQRAAMKTPITNPSQKAGQKRKILANSTSQNSIQGGTMSPMHKRSRTLGSSGDTEIFSASTSLPARSPRASLAGAANLRRSITQKSLGQSLSQQRLDQTQTDYFRLKAHGIDPDTPLVPETAAQVAARKQKEEEYRRSVDDRVWRRSSSALDRSRSKSSLPSSPAQSATSMPSSASILRATTIPQAQAPTTSMGPEDPFLRQLREAREALSTDETWFRSHTAELEKEVELQELRKSLDSQSAMSQDDSFARSAGGLARSLNGYEYVTPELKPGQTLSRTEERMRQTGARGLANKPIGGTPKPVAMSRKTASQLQNQGSPYSRKRSINEITQINSYSDVDHQQLPAAQFAQQVTIKKLRSNGVRMQALGAPQRTNHVNPFDHGTFDEEEKCEEYGDDGEQEELIEERYNGAVEDNDGAHAEAEYEEEYQEEEYEEEEEDDDQDVQYPDLQGYGEEYEDDEVEVDEQGIPLPPRGRSAATSTPDTGTGAGSTADAAIELSD